MKQQEYMFDQCVRSERKLMTDYRAALIDLRIAGTKNRSVESVVLKPMMWYEWVNGETNDLPGLIFLLTNKYHLKVEGMTVSRP